MVPEVGLMQNVTFSQPAGAPSTTWNDSRCREWLSANVPRVSYVGAATGGFIVVYADPVLSSGELSAASDAFAAFVAPPNTREQDRETREANLRTAVAIVRAYPQIASPSAAQRLAFERAIARVVGNLVRERLQEDGAD